MGIIISLPSEDGAAVAPSAEQSERQRMVEAARRTIRELQPRSKAPACVNMHKRGSGLRFPSRVVPR